MARGIFVTGTDTGVGKTLVAATLIRALAASGLRTAAMKPVAAGSRRTSARWRNDDADALLAACSGPLAYADVCPYPLAEPAAPEIAAELQSVRIDPDVLVAAYARLSAVHDIVVVEGVGGWEAPLDRGLLQSDLCRRLDLPVLMVVGLRLGCLNHARLTQRALAADGMRFAGWIGSAVDPLLEHAVRVEELLRRDIDAPHLGTLPHTPLPRADALCGLLRIDGL